MPFRGSVAVAAGRLTVGQLRGPRFRRLFPDVYVGADVELNHYLWSRAALVYAGEAAVISGLSAAYVWGVDLFPIAGAAPQLTVPVGRRLFAAGSHLVVVQAQLDADDIVVRQSLRVTSRLRTTFDLGRRLPRPDALAAMDAMAGRWDLAVANIACYARDNQGLRGCRQVESLVGLIEPRTESPMESKCRLVLVDGGLPRPMPQYEVLTDDGRFLARLDLAYPKIKIGIEYEGDHHRDRPTFRRDVARGNALADAGWAIVRATADDVLGKPDELVRRVRKLIEQRSQGQTY
jgi:hypothetical protein